MNLRWEGQNAALRKAALSKPGPAEQQGKGTRLFAPCTPRHTAVCFLSHFQQDVLIYSPVFLKVSFKDGPRHALLMG